MPQYKPASKTLQVLVGQNIDLDFRLTADLVYTENVTVMVDTDYLGIDQGPILAMIETHRSGFVWRVMRRNPHFQRGLFRAGFRGGWLEAIRQRPAA
jgi:hypothetical protein